MRLKRLFTFVFQAATVGLAAAVVLLLFQPDGSGNTATVAIQQEHGGASTPGPASYADAVERAAPAVVNVYTRKRVVRREHPFMDDPVFRRFFGDQFGVPRERMESSLGSGVIVSDEGYILTNHHVIKGADAIEVALHDGRSADAEVVGSDPETDLAVLRIDLDDAPSIRFGDSEAARVGDVVLAIGNPFGVGRTVTQGIVSATGRNQMHLSAFESFIQTDAAINPGNSGGALVDSQGRLIGINTAIFSRTGGHQGIGFAIPAHAARYILTDLLEHGEVVRGWLGVEVQSLSPELRESFRIEDDQGVLVAGVFRDGPAHAAGMRPGDVITAIEDEPLEGVESGLRRISELTPGDSVEVEGYRDGEPKSWDVEVARRPLPQR